MSGRTDNPPALPCNRCNGTGMDPDSDVYSPLVYGECYGARTFVHESPPPPDLAARVAEAAPEVTKHDVALAEKSIRVIARDLRADGLAIDADRLDFAASVLRDLAARAGVKP